MTLPSESPPKPRVRVLHVCAATWLLLISTAVIVNHVALSRLLEEKQSSTQSVEFAALSGMVAELAQGLSAIERQPAPVTQAGLASVHQALEERLSGIEQSVADQVPVSELASLRKRLDEIEARTQRARQVSPPAAPAPRPPQTESVQPRIVEPPFRLLGTELRAGERFLSVAPEGAASLSAVRILRPGEIESGWRLESLDGHTAVFSFEGQVRQLAVP